MGVWAWWPTPPLLLHCPKGPSCSTFAQLGWGTCITRCQSLVRAGRRCTPPPPTPPIWPSGAGVLCFASGGRSLPPASGSTGTAGTMTITCQKRLNSYPLPRPLQGGLWWKRTLSLLLPPQARSSLLPTSHLTWRGLLGPPPPPPVSPFTSALRAIEQSIAQQTARIQAGLVAAPGWGSAAAPATARTRDQAEPAPGWGAQALISCGAWLGLSAPVKYIFATPQKKSEHVFTTHVQVYFLNSEVDFKPFHPNIVTKVGKLWTFCKLCYAMWWSVQAHLKTTRWWDFCGKYSPLECLLKKAEKSVLLQVYSMKEKVDENALQILSS